MKCKNIIKLITLLIVVTFCSTSYGQNNIESETSIVGKWLIHDHRAVVEIFKDGDSYSGVIDSVLVDTQGKSLLGISVLKDFKLKNNKLIGGTMYDPETGGIYNCKLWLEDNNTLKVRDYCGVFFMTFSWTRYK